MLLETQEEKRTLKTVLYTAVAIIIVIAIGMLMQATTHDATAKAEKIRLSEVTASVSTFVVGPEVTDETKDALRSVDPVKAEAVRPEPISKGQVRRIHQHLLIEDRNRTIKEDPPKEEVKLLSFAFEDDNEEVYSAPIVEPEKISEEVPPIQEVAEEIPATEEASTSSSTETVETVVEEETSTSSNGGGEYIGTWYITGYDTCYSCCGKTDGITASGMVGTPWYTVAAPSGYPFGTILYIDGLGEFMVMDRGGSLVEGGRFDVMVWDHDEASSITGYYDVYVVRWGW